MQAIVTTGVFCLLFTAFTFAQNTLKVNVKPASVLKSKLSFHNTEHFDLYQLDGEAIYDFAQQNHSTGFIIEMEIEGNHHWELELQASKVHEESYAIITNAEEKLDVEKHITYKGFLKNASHIKVRMTIAKNLIHGVIFGEETYSFETIEKSSKRTTNDLIAFYKTNENIAHSGGCSHYSSSPHTEPILPSAPKDLLDKIDFKSKPEPPIDRNVNNTYCPKLSIVLDHQGLAVAGSIANFNADLQTIINIANGYYDDFNVEYVIHHVEVIATSPNPWPDDSYNSNSYTNNAEEHLTQNFREWAYPNLTPNNYNCALLFTGLNMGGIGYAFFGHMCPGDSYRYGEIDYQYNQSITQRANITTHELGHLWGAQHGPQSSIHIMSPSIWDGNLQWTSLSSSVISTAVNSTFNSCLPSCSVSCDPGVDNDNDGYCSDVDCDDNNGSVYPNAVEICDGIDNDCDGQIDEEACNTTYCTPIHYYIENELITNVTVGAINNSTGGWNTNITGYSDYTNLSTQVEAGTAYSITVTPNFSFPDSKLGIWADWNQDFTFQSNETIASLSGEGPWTVSFTPPADAVLGTTRLRVRLQFGPNYTPDPCDGAYNSGETEDYSLEVISTASCTNNEVILALQLDDYPEETSWEIVDVNGYTIASGGTYDGQEGELTTASVCLPDGCYDYIIYDDYGDGICCDYGNGAYTLTDINGQVLASGGQFTSIETTNFCLNTGGGCSIQLINNHDFETGWGIWNDGGTDARRNANDAPFANNGTFCIRLRDNTSESVMTTDVLDLSGFSEITVDFSYQVESFENIEDFWLQLSTDGGATFSTEKTWVHTVDFQNNERHNPSVNITGPFSSTTQLRFRCDASGNGDKVYIDDIVIEGCGTANGNNLAIGSSNSNDHENATEHAPITRNNAEKLDRIHLYPNPVSSELKVEFLAIDNESILVELFDLNGRSVLSQSIEANKGHNQMLLNLGGLSQGVYLLSILDAKRRLTKQVVIAR